MTEVKIVSKKLTFVIETVYIDKDETVETLLYWVDIALSAHTGVYAIFQYQGSTYVVVNDN